MPDVAADLQSAGSSLLPETGIEEFQSLDPDLFPSRACARAGNAAGDAPRDANGRFAKGHSGNPKGRPLGIRNPRRRPFGLLLRQARPGTLVPLIRRKRYLRLPVLRLVMPPRARQPDPGERLDIDFSRMGAADEIAGAIGKVFAAIGRGEITPAEGLRLARRSRKPLRAIRRRLWRDLARLEGQRRGKSSSRVPELVGSSPARGGEPAPDPIRGGAPHGPMGAPEGAEIGTTPPPHAANGSPPPRAREEPALLGARLDGGAASCR